MEKLYSVLLVPNHKDLSATLITITSDPIKFVNGWLENRTQFQMTKDEDQLIWRGINTLSNWGETPTMEGKDYALQADQAPYKIRCKEVLSDMPLDLQIDRNRDAYHYL